MTAVPVRSALLPSVNGIYLSVYQWLRSQSAEFRSSRYNRVPGDPGSSGAVTMTGSATLPKARRDSERFPESAPLEAVHDLLGAGLGLLGLGPLARGLDPERGRAGDHRAHQQGRGLDGDRERRLHRLPRRVPPRRTPPIPAASSCSPRWPISASRFARSAGLAFRHLVSTTLHRTGAPMADRPLRRRDPRPTSASPST